MNKILASTTTALLLLVLPLAGFAFSAREFGTLLEFPPSTSYLTHAPFSLPLFLFGYLLFGITTYALCFWCTERFSFYRILVAPKIFSLSFCCLLISWVIAWNRFPFFASLQEHTFLFLWLSYIGLTFSCSKTALALSKQTIATLFLFSSAFWWMFEFLNRFVENWSYSEVETFSPLGYFVFASLSFSTVLPAVYGTKQCLTLLFRASSEEYKLTQYLFSKKLLLLLSCLPLFLLPLFPNILFPVVWISPLTLLLSLLSDGATPQFILKLRAGKIEETIHWALSGLVCGFFWELWNVKSLAKWSYHIPFVNTCHLFEMPVLGFLGYLPFGVLCGLVIQLVLEDEEAECRS